MSQVKVPSTADGLQEVLSDPAKVKEFFSEGAVKNGVTKEFLGAYSRHMMTADPELKAQLNEQVQLGVAEHLKANGGETREKVSGMVSESGRPVVTVDGTKAIARGRGAVYNKWSPGAALEREVPADERFSSVGEICQAIKEEARPTATPNRRSLLAKLERVRSFQNSFGSEDPGAGGFLIPEEMRSQLLELSLEDTLVRSRATVIPMSTLRVPIPTVDDTSHVSSVFGGVTFYWAEESSALPESQASFGRVTLDAKKLVGFFKVPNELLADAPAFGAWFDTRVPQGLAFSEDIAFLTETGTGTPEGVIGSPGYVQVTRNTSTEILWPDLVGMYARMLPQSQNKAVWVASLDTFPQIAQLTLSTPGIWMGGYNAATAADAPPITIMGRPVYFTEKVPKLNSVGDISLIDFSYYLIGDRQSVAVSASEHFAFQNDQTAYRIIERVDGRPWLQTPLTPHNNSSATLSPYVGLSAA